MEAKIDFEKIFYFIITFLFEKIHYRFRIILSILQVEFCQKPLTDYVLIRLCLEKLKLIINSFKEIF